MNEIQEKLKRIKKVIRENELDALILVDSANLRWFFEMEEEFACILATGSKVFMFISPLSIGNFKKFESIKNIELKLLDQTFDEQIGTIAKTKGLKKIGFEGTLKFRLYERFKSALNTSKLECVKDLSSLLRSIKFKYEIELLKKAEKITKKTLKWIKWNLGEGMTEREIAWRMEKFARDNGADSLSFTPIIAIGKNSAVPHHLNSNTKLKDGDIILIDFGVKVGGYCADMTDTFVFGISENKEYEKVIEIVCDALSKAKIEIPKDLDVRIIDGFARNYISSFGYEPYIHSLGHGVGLEIHESPTLNKNAKTNFMLKTGMVVTLEPGIYMPGKFGVRLEEMYFV